MIYALVEPSIYMIASIIPTTRHLYRRINRKIRKAANLGSSDGDERFKNSISLSQSAELERMERSHTSSRAITPHVNIWQGDTVSSQEALTLGEWYQYRQDSNTDKPAKTPSLSRPEAQ